MSRPVARGPIRFWIWLVRLPFRSFRILFVAMACAFGGPPPKPLPAEDPIALVELTTARRKLRHVMESRSEA